MAEASLSSEDGGADQINIIPTATFFGRFQLYKPDGRFWFDCGAREGITSFKTEFQGRDDDIFLASCMKTGSNWLKALCSNILEDADADAADKINPRTYFTTVETTWYGSDHRERLAAMPSPRRLHTHLPYQWWPQSLRNSGCKVVYITRNPKDTFVSLWHFVKQFNNDDPDRPLQDYPLEEAFREFCDGEVWYGPFHDHVLEFWEESLKRPEKVLFLRYEELKKDTRGEVKRLAQFLGKPLRSDEDVDKVIWRSSLDRLKKLEVNGGNKSDYPLIPNDLYYRRGVVGDWRNHFTREMQLKLDQITLSKFHGSGLHLDDI